MGYDTGGVGGVTVTCPHTGEKFMGSDEASAWAMALSCSPNCKGEQFIQLKSPLTGEYQGNQEGSQPRMEANAEGRIDYSLPDISDATYAAGWAGVAARSIPSNISINPRLGIVQKYPVSLGTAELWKAAPQFAPKGYAEVNGNLVSGSVNYNSPATRPGGEAEPEYATSLQTDALLNSGETLGSQNRAGVGTTGVGGVSGILDKITTAPLALIAIIGVGLLLLFMMGKGLTGRATA